jgi:enoyl-CoA hydratase
VLGVPAAKLGLVVDHWTVRRIADEFTPSVARGMLVAAETYTAADLHRIGAIHRLGALEDAMVWAERLTTLAPLTMATHKLALESTEAGVDVEFETQRTAAWASADAEEGRTAFLEKRRADFNGR